MAVARAKKKKSRSDRYIVSDKQIEKIKKEATKEAVSLISRLAVAVMAQNHNLTEDEIFKDMQDISRWAQFYDAHYLSIKEIDEVIEKKGGIKFYDI
jgi:protein-tyrosine phosphatase